MTPLPAASQCPALSVGDWPTNRPAPFTVWLPFSAHAAAWLAATSERSHRKRVAPVTIASDAHDKNSD